MNPLANSDLQTYIRDLVDRHLPDKDSQDEDSGTRPKTRYKRSERTVHPTGDKKSNEKRKRAEKA